MSCLNILEILITSFLFFCISLTISESNQDNSILHAPKEKPLGAWGPWELCRSGEYTRGVRIKSQGPEDSDDYGISGIELYCGKAGDGPKIPRIRSSVAKEGKWATNPYFCEGYFEGFQLKIDTIADGDDYAGITNIRLFCSGGLGHFSPDTESGFGIWTEPKICKKGQAICGLRTMIKNSKVYESDENEDLVGINSLKMKCCDITEQVLNCFPYDKWEIIFEVDNTLAYEPLTYKYTKSIGTEKREENKDTKSGTLIGHGEERYAVQMRLRNREYINRNLTDNLITTVSSIVTGVTTPMVPITTPAALPVSPPIPMANVLLSRHDKRYIGKLSGDKERKLYFGQLGQERQIPSTVTLPPIFPSIPFPPSIPPELPKTTKRPQDFHNSYLFFTQNLKVSKATGFNWEMASAETWAPMRTTIVEVTVEPGHYVAFYQVVGICGDYFFRPEKFFQNGTFYDPNERRLQSSAYEWKNLARFSKVFNSFASMYQEGLRVIKSIAYVFGYKEPI